MDGLSAKATLRDNYRVDVSTGSHEFVVDQPYPVGRDAGPRPGEMVVVALVACKAQAVRQFCQRHHLTLHGCEVDADYRAIPDPHTGQRRLTFVVNVKLDAELNADQLAQLSIAVDEDCKVDQVLRAGAPIHTSVRQR